MSYFTVKIYSNEAVTNRSFMPGTAHQPYYARHLLWAQLGAYTPIQLTLTANTS
jgi:hypothetical protein